MMKTLITIVTAALLSAGCIQNIGDLRESLAATDEALDATSAALNETAAALNATGDAQTATRTNGTTPPVARMSIFAGNGALVYKSTFQAEDPEEIVFVDEKTQLNAIAGDSEALAKDATLAGFAWTLNGKAVEGGSKATVEIGEAGLYTLGLTVTDSHGKSDTHTVKLGVAPKPYEMTFSALTAPVAGGEGQGSPATVTIAIAPDASKGPARIQKVVITATPDATLDAILTVTDSEGGALGDADSAGHTDIDQTEIVELGAITLDELMVTISPFLGADADGVDITIVVTYLPLVEGLGDAGHGDHAGH